MPLEGLRNNIYGSVYGGGAEYAIMRCDIALAKLRPIRITIYPGKTRLPPFRYIVSTQGDLPRQVLGAGKKATNFFKKVLKIIKFDLMKIIYS